MPRRRRRRLNWPYLLTWLAILGSIAVFIAFRTFAGDFQRSRLHGDWWIGFVASCLDATVAIMFAAFGASIGSFLNVVAYRLPLGRSIGGHSGCPYCCSTIRSSDNVPVLGWIRLRGRCRTCHLPVSPQYPLIELLTALAFLSVFFTEFLQGGSNLPSVRQPSGFGVYFITVSPELMLRIVTYLIVLSGLIASAVISIKRKATPLSLFVWLIIPLVVGQLAYPQMTIVPWRKPPTDMTQSDMTQLLKSLDALCTILCGLASGVAVARLLAPVLYPGFDRTLIAKDSKTNSARTWVGALAVCGALVGWQSAVPMCWCIVMVLILARVTIKIGRLYPQLDLGAAAAWVWLGLLLFRTSWSWLNQLYWLPATVPEFWRQIIGALLLAPLCFAARNLMLPETVVVVQNDEKLEDRDEEREPTNV